MLIDFGQWQQKKIKMFDTKVNFVVFIHDVRWYDIDFQYPPSHNTMNVTTKKCEYP